MRAFYPPDDILTNAAPVPFQQTNGGLVPEKLLFHHTAFYPKANIFKLHDGRILQITTPLKFLNG
jgi:hypothetical protein